MSIDVPLRTVLEWVFFPPEKSNPLCDYIFMETSGRCHIGMYRKGKILVNHGISDVKIDEVLPRDVDSFESDIFLMAQLPDDMLAEMTWNQEHAAEMDLSDEPGGSNKVIELIQSPRRGKAEVRQIDRKVSQSILAGQTYQEFIVTSRIKPGSARDKIARQLWCFRTGQSKVI